MYISKKRFIITTFTYSAYTCLYIIILPIVDYRQNFGCSHMRSLHIFTESINSNCTFRSYPCALENLQSEKCSTCGEYGCNNMGYNAKSNRNGTYFTMTRAARPFCIS